MRIERKKLIAVTGLTSLLTVGMVHLASAQMPGAPGAGGASGPIDITAEEQEFSGDGAVIARGHVRVIYKDSTIVAPQATLYRDAGGNPNRAIFTGHPRLLQGTNKIDADKLTFEIAINKIVADGNAHSEVDVPEDESKTASVSPVAAAPPPKPVANTDEDDEDEDAPAVAPVAAAPAAPAKKKGGEKIITDADRQEYDSGTGRFDAIGHVRVVHGDIRVLADKLQLVYGANNKPETALFTGHVTASQNRNSTSADNITYSLSTKRMQATGNVKSKVIQEKTDTKKPVEGEPTAKLDSFLMSPANAAVYHDKHLQGEIAAQPGAGGKAEDDKPIWIYSDAQDYSKDTGRVSAHGNVKVVYGEMYGSGPSIIMTRKSDGKADKVYFQGRSQISQPGRRWIADEITFVVEERRVIAQGNSKAMILQSPSTATATASASKKGHSIQIMPEKKNTTPNTQERENSRVAGHGRTISASKGVETPK